MVKLNIYELRLIAKNRGINNYLNISAEKLLSTLDKLEHIAENLSKNKLNKIVKMQNLSLNELKQIDKMNSLSLDQLKQIAITRHIKNYKYMLKEDLLIALLKFNKRNTKFLNNKSNNIEIRTTKKLF